MDFECEDIMSLDDLINRLKLGSYYELIGADTYNHKGKTWFECEINEEKREVVITAQEAYLINFSNSFKRKEVFLVQEDTLIVKANSNEIGYFVPSVLRHCAFLKKLRFEEGFEHIMSDAFSNFYSLTSVEFNEGLEEILDEAFSYCVNLREVKFPKSLRLINYNAFENCFSLEKIEMTGDDVEIEDCCFKNCESLRFVSFKPNSYDLERPYGSKSALKLDYDSFADCDTLELIEVPTDITLDSFESVHCELPKQVKLVFYGTGLTMTNKERKSLLEKSKSLEEKPETVYEALRLLYPEEFVVKDFESDKVAEEVEETSLF